MTKRHLAGGLHSLGGESERIAMRPYPWKTRMGVPAAMAVALLLAVGWAARESFWPVVGVRVVPVVLRAAGGPATGGEPAVGGGVAGGAGAAMIAQAAGWVEPDPYAVGVSALTDGIVREVLVLEGQRVVRGEVVARLVDEDAKLAVKRAEADLALRRAELTAAQRRWEHPVERVRAVAASRAELEQARAELLKLDADLAAEVARAEELGDLVGRFAKSVAAGATPEQELAGAKFRLEAQRSLVKATEARRPVLEALVEQKSAEVTAAEENARLRIEEGQALDSAKALVAQAEAALGEAALRLYRTEVRSPADGVVMTRLAEPGGKLVLEMDSPTSAYVARLFDPMRLQVRVDVPLAEAHKIGVGMTAEVSSESVPGRTMRGEVTRVVHEADVAKNTLQFKVRIVDGMEGLKPEVLARVKFFGGTGGATSRPAAGSGGAQSAGVGSVGGEQLPFVPRALLRAEGDRVSVLVVDRGRGVAEERKVTLAGVEHDGWVAVSSGLAAGDVVIAEPADVVAGARVRVLGEADGKSGGELSGVGKAGR